MKEHSYQRVQALATAGARSGFGGSGRAQLLTNGALSSMSLERGASRTADPQFGEGATVRYTTVRGHPPALRRPRLDAPRRRPQPLASRRWLAVTRRCTGASICWSALAPVTGQATAAAISTWEMASAFSFPMRTDDDAHL
jgi:hypothetical protein